MEWIETSGATIEDAVESALGALGIAADELEYEVLQAPKPGLFGRVRAEARLRARVRPERPRAKPERRPKRAADDSVAAVAVAASSGEEAADARPARKRSDDSRPRKSKAPAHPEARAADTADDTVAAGNEFLGGLLDAFGLDADVAAFEVAEQTLEFRVTGSDLGLLIGPKAQTLLAVQELLRTYLHHEVDDQRWRVMLDVGGYRAKRRVALEAFTRQVAATVVATGERRALEPMTAADRKVVHDTVQTIDGVESVSEGEDPDRRVVLLPS